MSIFKKVLSVGSGKLASELNNIVQAINEKEKEFVGEAIYPEPSDYDRGYMLRYFLKKDTSDKIIEVSKVRYNKSISKLYMKGTIIKWILQKPVKDIFNQGYLFKGAATRNQENTLKASLEVKGIDKFITQYDKFVNIESDVEGYKFEDLSKEEKLRIIKRLPSTLQKPPAKLPKPKFKTKRKLPERDLKPRKRRFTPRTSGGGGGFSEYRDEGFNEEGNVGGGMGGDYGNSGQNESMSQY